MSQAGKKEIAKRRRGYAMSSWEFRDEQPSQSQPAALASQAPGEMPSQSQGLRAAAEPAVVSVTPADAPSSQQAAAGCVERARALAQRRRRHVPAITTGFASC